MGRRLNTRMAPPTAVSTTKRDLLSIADLTHVDVAEIFAFSRDLKRQTRAGLCPPLLGGKTLAMIFQKPSLRTRVTFEVGITQLGGSAIYLAPENIGPGKRESIADIAQNLALWVDLIVARTYAHAMLVELARAARVPVINGLSDLLHPCQVLADCFTLIEHRGDLAGAHVVFVGDGNNVAHSWLHAAAVLGFDFTMACPRGYEPDPEIVAFARGHSAGRIEITRDPAAAVQGADVIYTDVWASMGQERDAAARRRIFRPYQVNERLVARAARDVRVMHCLPAHRGDEITDGVLDGPHSIVLQQAENRLHVQKGIMVWLCGAIIERAAAGASPQPPAVRPARRGRPGGRATRRGRSAARRGS